MKNQRSNSENIFYVKGSFHLKLIAKIISWEKWDSRIKGKRKDDIND